MIKFKIGDKVKIIQSGYGFSPRELNKIVTIKYIIGDTPTYADGIYLIEEDNISETYVWGKSFELVNPKQKIIKPYGIVNFMEKICLK